MKALKLELQLQNLGQKTHIWFPAPPGTRFSLSPRVTNSVAYFVTRGKSFTVSGQFPVNSLPLGGGPQNYLSAGTVVQSNHPMILLIASKLATARECFDWVTDYLEDANPIRGLYTSLQALTDRRVDCGGFSTLLVALLRAKKIPARCVFGWAPESVRGYHAWVEHFDEEKKLWIASDPSVAYLIKKTSPWRRVFVGRRTKLDAGFGFINDERIPLSAGEDKELIGDGIKWTTPLLQSPVVVSVDNRGIPQSIEEKLNWRIK